MNTFFHGRSRGVTKKVLARDLSYKRVGHVHRHVVAPSAMKKALILSVFLAVSTIVSMTVQAALVKPAHVVSFCETYEECDPRPDTGTQPDPGPDSTDYPEY